MLFRKANAPGASESPESSGEYGSQWGQGRSGRAEPIANQEHLAILSQGAEAWNAWRHACIAGAFESSRGNLIVADLADAKLTRANLRRANLALINLIGAD